MKFPSQYKPPLISSLGTYIWISALINLQRNCNSQGNIRNMVMFENKAVKKSFFWICSLFMTRVDHTKTKRIKKEKMLLSQPTLSLSAFSARSILDSTLSCDVTVRDSPILSQTMRGQRVKRECLGTRLLLSWLKVVREKKNSPLVIEHCHVWKIQGVGKHDKFTRSA